MKVAVYARCSTNKQDLDLQLFDLRGYCARNKYTIHAEYTDIESGSKEDRQGLKRLMQDAHKNLFDMVLVWRFDRFSRSLKHLVTSLEYLRSKHVQFVSYNDNIDTGTPAGEAMFGMVAVMAQFERRIIQERVLAGLRKAREKGIRLGRPNKPVNTPELERLRHVGYSYRQIGKMQNMSHNSVRTRILLSGRSDEQVISQ